LVGQTFLSAGSVAVAEAGRQECLPHYTAAGSATGFKSRMMLPQISLTA